MNNSTEGLLRGGQFKKLIETTMLVIKDYTGLKRVEIDVLFYLSQYPEHNTMKDICTYLQMNKGHISTAVDSLTKQNYVAQQKDEHDHRYVHYSLTEKADQIVKDMSVLWEKMTKQLVKNVSAEDIAIFEKVSGIIGCNIEYMLNNTEWMK